MLYFMEMRPAYVIALAAFFAAAAPGQWRTEEPPPGAQEVGDALRSAAPWLILQVLLRLFLRG